MLLWFVIAAIIGTFMWIRVDSTYFALAREGIEASGTVQALDPATKRVDYIFHTRDNRDGYGSGVVGQGTPSFGNLEIGDQVLVFYLERDGTILCHLGNPGEDLKAHAVFLVVVSAILSAVPIMFTRWMLGVRSTVAATGYSGRNLAATLARSLLVYIVIAAAVILLFAIVGRR
jgi:hypothetical protein